MAHHIRVSTFAQGSTGGGSWASDWLITGPTPEATFEKALKFVKKRGYASQVTLKFCQEDGEDFV